MIVKTLEETPKNATHWSPRSMAAATGMSQSAISRIWRAFGLQPQRAKTFKLSRDPLFIEKVRDVVGLYLDPPERALVLCVDEKSQIQALDRSQPVFSEQLDVLRNVAGFDPETRTWRTLLGEFNLKTLDMLQRLFEAAQKYGTSVHLKAVPVPANWPGPTLAADADLVQHLCDRLDAGRQLGQVTPG